MVGIIYLQYFLKYVERGNCLGQTTVCRDESKMLMKSLLLSTYIDHGFWWKCNLYSIKGHLPQNKGRTLEIRLKFLKWEDNFKKELGKIVVETFFPFTFRKNDLYFRVMNHMYLYILIGLQTYFTGHIE